MSSGARKVGSCARWCLVVFAMFSALFVSGPAFYWRIMKGLQRVPSSSPPSSHSSSSCPHCVCDCPSSLSLQNIAPGLLNLTIQDCGREDPEVAAEMEKRAAELLKEEAALQVAVAEESRRHMNYTMEAARRQGIQFEREAHKCNTATEACEEARERAEAALKLEKKATVAWELRARHLGWTDPA